MVLPTLNEYDAVWDVIQDVADAGADEIVVVDDGSTDGTPTVVRASEPTLVDRGVVLELVERADPNGLAGAIFDGLRLVESEVAVVMDADGQHPAEAVPELIDALDQEEVDVAIGSRYDREGDVDESWGTSRAWASRLSTAGLRVVCPAARQTTDPLSGMFAVRREVLAELVDDVEPTGWKALLELLDAGDLEATDVPIEFGVREGGESKLDHWAIIEIGQHILSMPTREWPGFRSVPVRVRAHTVVAAPFAAVMAMAATVAVATGNHLLFDVSTILAGFVAGALS